MFMKKLLNSINNFFKSNGHPVFKFDVGDIVDYCDLYGNRLEGGIIEDKFYDESIKEWKYLVLFENYKISDDEVDFLLREPYSLTNKGRWIGGKVHIRKTAEEFLEHGLAIRRNELIDKILN